jgi:hypothetical protein
VAVWLVSFFTLARCFDIIQGQDTYLTDVEWVEKMVAEVPSAETVGAGETAHLHPDIAACLPGPSAPTTLLSSQEVCALFERVRSVYS